MTIITQEYLTKIATRLQAARESCGLSINQVRQYAVFTTLDFQLLEDGKLAPELVSYNQIDRLCAIYGVTRDDIDAVPMAYISDDEMLSRIQSDWCKPGEFRRWLKIDRWIMQKERAINHG